mmetsp:Transcript_11415/g.23337  ORF Transcript_11415/g.23337 Transcript_11415/m.23337 type:complete len:299 (-) Transcript_11415:538-1434(-)
MIPADSPFLFDPPTPKKRAVFATDSVSTFVIENCEEFESVFSRLIGELRFPGSDEGDRSPAPVPTKSSISLSLSLGFHRTPSWDLSDAGVECATTWSKLLVLALACDAECFVGVDPASSSSDNISTTSCSQTLAPAASCAFRFFDLLVVVDGRIFPCLAGTLRCLAFTMPNAPTVNVASPDPRVFVHPSRPFSSVLPFGCLELFLLGVAVRLTGAVRLDLDVPLLKAALVSPPSVDCMSSARSRKLDNAGPLRPPRAFRHPRVALLVAVAVLCALPCCFLLLPPGSLADSPLSLMSSS